MSSQEFEDAKREFLECVNRALKLRHAEIDGFVDVGRVTIFVTNTPRAVLIVDLLRSEFGDRIHYEVDGRLYALAWTEHKLITRYRAAIQEMEMNLVLDELAGI